MKSWTKDGTMSRGEKLQNFASTHNLKITSVAEIIKYRVLEEIIIREVARETLETEFGDFTTIVFEDDVGCKEHLALLYGDPARSDLSDGPLVRIHSECLTGDVFGSRRCDCGEQLKSAMQQIVQAGAGVVLYLRQEGRGIGLTNKLKAYALQDMGHDTVEANHQLGFEADQRDFYVAGNMLKALGISTVQLLTNNPRKLTALELSGIKVSQRLPIIAQADEFSSDYLETKRTKLGHILPDRGAS